MAVNTIKTTVRITWTSAARVRMTANVDFPEYGVLAGETFYLVRASVDDGMYYIVTWDEIKMCWLCRCPARKPCKHMKLVNLDCRGRTTMAQVSRASAQPVISASALPEVPVVSPTAIPEASTVTAEQVETLVQDHELSLLGMAMKAYPGQQKATTAVIDKMTAAPLNGNKGFSYMR